MLVARRTQISSDDIVDATIATGDIANRAVSRPKMSFLPQIGSATPGTVAYGTPFKGGEPVPALTPITAGSLTGARVKRIASASFDFRGAAGSYYGYVSAGSA
ncbi:hypothetical protein KAR91_77815 [Candidatus Pacearchaeota archaeon]|nr:hypothetical protein [Candidatus Pacearchaeota archaeon]